MTDSCAGKALGAGHRDKACSVKESSVAGHETGASGSIGNRLTRNPGQKSGFEVITLLQQKMT